MNVQDLIDILSDYDPDKTVYVRDGTWMAMPLPIDQPQYVEIGTR